VLKKSCAPSRHRRNRLRHNRKSRTCGDVGQAVPPAKDFFSTLLVVVDDLNVMDLAFPPGEANSPPLIDPYAVCPRPIVFELLQTVTGRDA